MARRVFFSFHYDNDIWRVNTIRNMGVTKDWETMPFLDHASWEAVKRKGDAAIKAWIDRQLDGSGVTVVLIGCDTAARKYVKYEIEESHRRGNGLLGIYIHGIKNQEQQTCSKGSNPFSNLTVRADGLFGPYQKPLSDIYPTYDWIWDSGRQNIGTCGEKGGPITLNLMTGISKKEFLRRYSTSLLEGTGALFIGAGVSRPAGFADWRELLKEIAEDLQIDIVREHDLIAVAQFEANRKGNKDSLNEAIIRHFDRDGKLTPNHELLARLPVDTVWTTNYDKLLERAYERANKKCDVKQTASQLTSRKSHSDVVLFKMHGDVDDPQNAILTKDDYECYEAEHGAFTVQLLADLISKRFLFLGFSFTDPNIDYTFNRLRRLLNPRKPVGGGKEHYCVLRKPHADDYTKLGVSAAEQERLFKADCARFEHRVRDMTRFGIQAVVIERYEEITELLAALHQTVSTRTVMISGAVHDYSPLGQARLDSLCEELGRRLIEDGYDIVSGVGKGIGASMMVGAHKALARPDASRLAQRLKLFPFPYWHPVVAERTAYYETNRQEMAAQAGVSIFIAGNKLDGSNVIESPGVHAEFTEAVKNHHFIIPVGATGHAANAIWKKVIADPAVFYKKCDVSAELKVLGDTSSTNDDLLNGIFSILNKIRHCSL